ncbi:MAG TPA: secretin N-terminal domain-containing protein, partial [Planctomycetota bacterium]|nr:secretin N-terminal domain-containing protein [Planctomycetota bacterium]
GMNFVFAKDSLRSKKVTLQLSDVQWRVALDTLAHVYKLILDESQIANKIITIDEPEHVTFDAFDTPVYQIVETIRQQAKGEINIITSPSIGQEKLTVHLKDVPWRTALDMVTKPVGLVVIDDPFNTLRIATMQQLEEEQQTRILKLNYIQPLGNRYSANFSDSIVQKQAGATEEVGKGLLEVISSVKSPNGKIIFEKRTNALIVTDTPKKLDEIQKLLFLLDTAPKQIHIAVKIIEMSDQDSEKMGFKWASGTGAGFSVSEDYSTQMRNGFPFSFGGNESLDQTLLGRMTLVSTTNSNGLINYLSPAALAARTGVGGLAGTPISSSYTPATFGIDGKLTLDMIRSKTKSAIVQAPLLITLDHEEAIISVGRLIRFAEQKLETTATGGTVSAFSEAQGSPINEGVTLLILPHVTGVENNILLTVVPKLETLDSFTSFQGPGGFTLQLPQTSNKVLLAKLLLRNGETAIIGGVKATRDDLFVSRVPFLGDLPILGFLFRHNETRKSLTDTYISIEPTIIDFNDKEQADRIRRKVQKEMSAPSLETEDTMSTMPEAP